MTTEATMLRPADAMLQIPTFEEGRLRYRAPRMDDFDAFAAFRASDRSAGIGGPNPRTQAFSLFLGLAGHWHLRGYGRWIVADIETDTALGIVGPFYPESWPEPELAWTVFEHAEGRGIAYEAARFARRYMRETLGWRRIVSCCAFTNARTVALARRLGAVHDYDFQHPEFGTLNFWRHPDAEAAA